MNVAVEEILDRLAELRSELDGPTSLRELLAAVVAAPEGLLGGRAREALPAVEAEIGRIEVATIASFLHPNEAGAHRYADVIVDRYARHARASARRELERLGGGRPVSLRDSFRRYGFSADIGLRAFLQHMLLDTLAVEMRARSLTPLIPPDRIPVFLLTGEGRRFQLDDPFGGLSVVDTLGRLHLGDVSALGLELGVDLPVRIEIEDFRFLINGKTVFRSPDRTVVAGGARLRFRYPSRAA